MPVGSPLFTKYESAVRSFSGDPCSPNLLLAQDDALAVYYAPFEWISSEAKVILVGITPGKTQATNALMASKTSLCTGAGIPD